MASEDRSLAEWAASDIGDEPAPVPAPPEPPKPEEPAPVEVPDPAEEAAVEAPEGEEPAVVEAEPEPVLPAAAKAKKPEPLPKWMRDRLAEQTAKQREAERLAADAEARALAFQAELEAIRKRVDSGEPIAEPSRASPGPDYVPRADLDRRAAEIAQMNAFNASADQAYYAGKAAYKDFDAALEPLTQMGALSRLDFQQAALETGHGHEVLYALGSDPDRASQILGYLKSGNPVKAGIEMDRIARDIAVQKAAAAKPKRAPVSQAPAPIRPVGGSALPVVDLERADDETFDRELTRMLHGFGWGR